MRVCLCLCALIYACMSLHTNIMVLYVCSLLLVCASFLSRILVRLCRYALVAFGFWWINVKGKRASREEAPVIIAPLHSSYIDFLVAGIVSDFVPCGVHRRENGNIPLIGSKKNGCSCSVSIFLSITFENGFFVIFG